jgi:periplasmic protein TonB
MREPSRFVSFSASETWFRRVRENLHQLFDRSVPTAKSANGAPIHLLTTTGGRPARSQTASLVVHALVIAALLVTAKTGLPTGLGIAPFPVPLSPLFAPAPSHPAEKPSLGRKGGGGDDNPEPTRRGFLPLHSIIQLAPPRLPDQQQHPLPVTVTIFDPAAPNLITSISNLGLPQSLVDTNSGGPGHKGIGSGDDGGVGDRRGTGDGEGQDTGMYSGLVLPTCSYCPIPVYTDEARHVKVQGTVTLRVKVGTDGRAGDIRVMRGVGYGLEERAEESVRTWKFKPAHDSAGRAIAAWVTIELRLF